MKFNQLLLITCVAAVLFTQCKSKKSSDPTEEKIEKIISEMTLEEKVGQMTQITLSAVCYTPETVGCGADMRINQVKLDSILLTHHIGSILNTGDCTLPRERWYQIIGKIQETALTKGRLKIPVLYGIDAIHGVNYTDGATLFPQEIALAATWDPYYAEQTGVITAYEVRASAIPWNFSPVLDVARQPLWSRVFETFGEDTYMASVMGAAIVKGYQGDNISHREKVAACMKHFVGYSYAFSGKDRTPIMMSERVLRETFLPPFQRAVEAGALTVMVNSSEINGVPVHADYHILTEILKQEMKFEGLVVTDWEDIIKLCKEHKVAATYKDAVALSINAGVDMSMTPYDVKFCQYLIELVNEGKVPMERIDDAVRRVLRVKFKLGLFEHPYYEMSSYPKFGSKEFSDVSYHAAQECLTLLKNDNNILPLKKDKKVLVTGVAANSLTPLNGAWTYTWQGRTDHHNPKNKPTIYQSLIEKVGEGNVKFVEGTTYDSSLNVAAAVSAARQSDYIVVCLGERPGTEGPGNITDLTLDRAQLELVKELSKTGKPIILVLAEGRPRVITEIVPLAQGIVMAYLPGNEGGRAIADVLYGDFNPCGKLPYTYPRSTGSLATYDHKYSEGLPQKNPADGFYPLYEFGYGLSYTTFATSDLTINKNQITDKDTITVTVKVKNTGAMAGKEVVQLYVKDEYASITPAVKKLRGFTKVLLQPGEEKTVTFTISRNDLTFVNTKNEWVTEPGAFSVIVGGMSKGFELK
jgi:beta-glucosidase